MYPNPPYYSGPVHSHPSSPSGDLDQEVTLPRVKLPRVVFRRERDCVRFDNPATTRLAPPSLISPPSISIGIPSKSLPASLLHPLPQKPDRIELTETIHHTQVTVPVKSMSLASPILKLKPLCTVAPTCLHQPNTAYPTRLDFQSVLPSPRSQCGSPCSALSLHCTHHTAQHTHRPPKTFLPLSACDTEACPMETEDGKRTPRCVWALSSTTPSPETSSRMSCGTKTTGPAILQKKLGPVRSTCR